MLVLASPLVYAALQNDVFSELIPPMDDLGFTHDNVLAIGVPRDDIIVGGKIFDRWITSRTDRRRWDQLDLLGTYEQTLWADDIPADAPSYPPHWRLAVQARLGATLGGNFGGQTLQNGWHALTGTGPTVEEGLANDYPGLHDAGVLAGARAHLELGTDHTNVATGMATANGTTSTSIGGPPGTEATAYANLDGQGTVWAGVSSIEAALGGWAGWHHVGAHAEAAVTRYHVADPNLALPGGYGVGWQFEWRAGIDVTWSRYRLAYEYRANEGGSGEPIGVVAFSMH